MPVALGLVKSVSPIAYYVRPDRNRLTADSSRLFFDGANQDLPNPARADLFIYDQSTNFYSGTGFNASKDKSPNPAGDLPAWQFSNVYGVLAWVAHSFESLLNLLRCAFVAQLSCKRSHSVEIGEPRYPHDARRNESGLQHHLLFSVGCRNAVPACSLRRRRANLLTVLGVLHDRPRPASSGHT